MTELTIPEEADPSQARELVRGHVSVGDEVRIGNAERSEGRQLDVRGEVTGLEDGYVELEGGDPDDGRVRYDEIQTLTIVSRD